MTKMCSVNRCTRGATWVLMFDAAGPGSDLIRVRAEAYGCKQHRDEIAVQVHAYNEVDAATLAVLA